MGVKQSEPKMIFEDNQVCIALSRNNLLNNISKNIEIQYLFNREKVESVEVDLKYRPTKERLLI